MLMWRVKQTVTELHKNLMLFTCAMMGAFQTRGKRRNKISLTNQVRNAGG